MEIEELTGNCGNTYMTRGHVDAEVMLSVVADEYDVARSVLGKPKHTHMRATPWAEGIWYSETSPGRGAFPATIIIR